MDGRQESLILLAVAVLDEPHHGLTPIRTGFTTPNAQIAPSFSLANWAEWTMMSR
jgi:hypothetical protein